MTRRDWVIRKKGTDTYYTGQDAHGRPQYRSVDQAHLWGGHDVTVDDDEEVVEVEVTITVVPLRVDTTRAERNAERKKDAD